jgi:lipopolysaccharide/colanic/teichoic acid biosynthesis glycosyltransferase
MMPEQRHLYPCTGYYHLRPGITGPWQVSERNQTTFAERARFDRAYLANLTFAADISLLLATFRVVLKGTGR